MLRYFEDGVFLLVSGDDGAYIDMLDARDEYYMRHYGYSAFQELGVGKTASAEAVMLAS